MSVISKIKQLAKLKRKAYRDAYVEEHVKTSLPFQIRALREQREWSQGDLGEKTGMRQNAISRLEKPDYGSLSVNTLIRLASAFDVALLIKFVPFRKLLDEFSDLSMEALEVPSFENEVPELEQVAAMPNWYQGSFVRIGVSHRSLDLDVTQLAFPTSYVGTTSARWVPSSNLGFARFWASPEVISIPAQQAASTEELALAAFGETIPEGVLRLGANTNIPEVVSEAVN